MKSFKFYIGTKAGECAKDTRFEDWTFSKKQVVEAIEQNRQMYNILYGETMPFEGYSLYSVDGYWNGVQETSYVLEVMIEDLEYEPLAVGLKAALHQDSIMVTVQELKVEFL